MASDWCKQVAAACMFIVLLMWGGATHAQDAPRIATYGDWDAIQSQIIMAQAQLQLEQAQAALAQVRKQSSPAASQAELPVPEILGIFGRSEAPYVRLSFGAGSQVIGRPGDVLPGGYLVTHVSAHQVRIKDQHGTEITLRFAAQGGRSESATAGDTAAPGNLLGR